MQAEPFSGVAVPLDVEAIAAGPVEAGEGGVELFAGILTWGLNACSALFPNSWRRTSSGFGDQHFARPVTERLPFWKDRLQVAFIAGILHS